MACNDANAIPTRLRYAAAAIAGRYGWEGLGGQGMDCEWLAGLVWEGLEGLGMGCEWLAGLVSRVCVYVDWRGSEVGLGCEWLAGLVWEQQRWWPSAWALMYGTE